MFTAMFRLVLAGVLLAAAPACGGGEAVVKAVKKDPAERNAKQLVVEAREQVSAGKNDDADRSYGEAYANASENKNLAFDILKEWVEFLTQVGRRKRACDVAKPYYDANTTDVRGYALYADALIANNDAPRALKVTDELVQLASDDAGAHERHGRALLLAEKTEDGIEELRKAVQLEPANAKYHMSLGSALHQTGDFNKAALEFRAALKNAPDDPEAHVLLGMALRDQSELDESRTYLDRAIALDPKNGRAYFELGVLFNKQLKQADAEDAFAKAVKYSPNDSRFWYAYGEIYRVQDKIDDAISAYRHAVQLEPPFPKATGKLGSMLVEKKLYDEAESYLIAAIRQDPKNATNYWFLGKSYAAKHKNRAAIDNYELFLKYASTKDPDRERAKDIINRLRR
jgi:superkiller protein 3